MNTKLILTFVLSFVLLSTRAQNIERPSPTTVEEYNYLTKGYAVQIESGLDMKKGYSLDDLFDHQLGNYRFIGKSLIRNAKKQIAALLVITKSNVSGKTYYICIPHGGDQELVQRYLNDLANWDASILRAYTSVMTFKLGNVWPYAYEMEKKLKN